MSRIRIGVVGVGVAALNSHIPVVAQSREFDLVALMDRDPAKLELAKRLWPTCPAFTNLDGFLAVAGLEAVIVATPPDSHRAIAGSAISRGKHVLVEKPLATSLSECRALIELSAHHGVRLLVGHEKRFHPTFEKIHSILRSGELGRPYYCGVHWASNAKMDPANLVPEGYREGYDWRWTNPNIGGGIVQDHLPHYVDLIRYWLEVDPEAVYALNLNVARDWLGWQADKSLWEDLGLVVVRFSSGFVMRFETGTVGRSLSPLWSQGSGIGEWTEYGYILGTEGQLVFDLLPWDSSENGRIALWNLKRATRDGIGWSYIEQPEPCRRRGSPSGAAHAMFAGQLREFARAVNGQPSQCATGEDGAICLAMVESAYESAQTHQECRLEGAVTGEVVANPSSLAP